MTTHEMTDETIPTLSAKLGDVRSQYKSLMERFNALHEQNRSLVRDLHIIGTKVRQAAIDHDLCSVYDDVVGEINDATRGTWLSPLTEDAEVEITVRVRVTYKPHDPDDSPDLEYAVISALEDAQNRFELSGCEDLSIEDWEVSS